MKGQEVNLDLLWIIKSVTINVFHWNIWKKFSFLPSAANHTPAKGPKVIFNNMKHLIRESNKAVLFNGL